MQVRVLFFGILKDLAGMAHDSLEVPEHACVGDVVDLYAKKIPRLQQFLPSVALALNREYTRPDAKLRAGDEIGLLPPVSGGAPRACIVREKIGDAGFAGDAQAGRGRGGGGV